MKRYNYLYPQIIDKDNLRLAHKNAKKGKKHYSEVKEVDAEDLWIKNYKGVEKYARFK